MQELVTLTTNDITKALPVTTSRIIANEFNKRHSDVIRKIELLIDDDSAEFFNERKITPVSYIDLKGESRKEYQLNRDQFMFVVMGFTGSKANIMKTAFIKRFNFMERELLVRAETRYIGKQVRHSLTDSIKENLEDNTNHKKHAYGNYTKLIYKKVLGSTVKKYKEKHRIKDTENVRNHLSIKQLDRIQSLETKIANYIEVLNGVFPDKEIYIKIKALIEDSAK
jgi:Rha family phage regulatory protein